jgi:xanthine dehydrogenase accessory factor
MTISRNTARPVVRTPTSDHAALFETALKWMHDGHKVAIATVLQTWGSAPRPTGSHMIVRDDGLFEGSVSGGCIEGEVIAGAQTSLASNVSKSLSFGVADAMAWEVGLACGGQISILVQPLGDAHFPPLLLARIVEETRSGRIMQIEIDETKGTAKIAETEKPDDGTFSYAPAARLAIVGAVHITQYLAPMASQLGYQVTIIDPRDMFARADRMQALQVIPAWPDEALAGWKPDGSSAIVALTHDPKLDDPALASALQSPAFYIAALGSRKNHSARLQRLQALGFSDSDCNRIHGPAGLAIGAKSPAEIAISVLAQMTAVRRTGTAIIQ